MIILYVIIAVILFAIVKKVMDYFYDNKKASIFISSILLIPVSAYSFENISSFGGYVAIWFHSFLFVFAINFLYMKVIEKYDSDSYNFHYLAIIVIVIILLNFIVCPLIYGFPKYNSLTFEYADAYLLERDRGRGHKVKIMTHCTGVWGDFNFKLFDGIPLAFDIDIN